MQRGNNPRRHRARKRKGIADRHDPVAHARLAAVAKLDEGQGLLRLDLQHRQIGRRIAPDQLGGIFFLVGHGHGDRIHRRPFGPGRHHMIVGDDVTVGRNQEARTQRLRLPCLRTPARLLLPLAEQVAERRPGEGILHRDPLLGGNVDDGRLQLFNHVGQAGGRACGRCRLQSFILGCLRADIGRGDGDGGAAQQQGAGNGISVTHS